MILIVAALIAGLPAAPTYKDDARDRFTSVSGARYRVRVENGEFTVFKKAAVVRDTIEERDAQRQAVRQATGCDPVDELQRNARLRGKLNCPSVPQSAEGEAR